jgi:hypothetical protein
MEGCMGKMTYAELELKIMELESRVDALEKRPRAGRPGDRVRKAEQFLRVILKNGPVKVSSLMREGITKQGFNEALIRKAARRLEVVRHDGKWGLLAADSLGDDE